MRTNPKQVVWGFGHDFSDAEVWIVQGGGKRIARLASNLTRQEAEEAGRIIRQAPVLVDTCREAARRLAKAQHPNAKALLLKTSSRGATSSLQHQPRRTRICPSFDCRGIPSASTRAPSGFSHSSRPRTKSSTGVVASANWLSRTGGGLLWMSFVHPLSDPVWSSMRA